MLRRLSISGLVLFAFTAFPQTATTPSFDVASIRPSTMDYGSYVRYLPGGRLSAMSWIKQVIQVAYGVADYQVTGGPAWLTTDRYTIEAKAANPDATKDEINGMLQSLLAERFKLQLRKETKDFSVYDLVVDKDGPKLTPLKEGEASKCGKNNAFACGYTNPGQLLGALKPFTGRPIFDKTGISGRFDILLDFDVYSERGKTPPEGYDKPSLKDALHDQLGLKLVPHMESLPVWVVDSIERPSDN
jgi:bla regulator protein blaR1